MTKRKGVWIYEAIFEITDDEYGQLVLLGSTGYDAALKKGETARVLFADRYSLDKVGIARDGRQKLKPRNALPPKN